MMLKKIGYIGFIMILLLSTVQMSISLHYCKHKLYDIGIFSKTMSCCIDNSSDIDTKKHNHKKAHSHTTCNIKNHKSKDCQNKTIQTTSVDDFIISDFDFKFSQEFSNPLFAVFFVNDTFESLLVKVIDKIPKFYISPPTTQEVLSLIQTYII